MGALSCCQSHPKDYSQLDEQEKQTQKKQLHEILSCQDKFNHNQCVLCKQFDEKAHEHKFQLSEFNSIVVTICQGCKNKELTPTQKEYLLYLDHDPDNSLYFKVVKQFTNGHKKTEETDRLALLSDLVYYDDWEKYFNIYNENPIYKDHLKNLKILKKDEYVLMAVDDEKKHCYFSFRGTKMDGSDLWNDVQIAFTGTANTRLDHMDEFYDENKVEYMKKGYRIIVTGHSLGGNVAEHILIENIEVHHCESFNAGNSFDFMPDILENFFQNEDEKTLKQMQGDRTQEEIARQLGQNIESVRARINKAQNSEGNVIKEREERIIAHRISGDPISIEKIHFFSHRYEVKTEKKLFGAHLMDNFLGLIITPEELLK